MTIDFSKEEAKMVYDALETDAAYRKEMMGDEKEPAEERLGHAKYVISALEVMAKMLEADK